MNAATEISQDNETLGLVDALQNRYIDALDNKDMTSWLATFANQDASAYILTTRDNEDSNLPLALMLDDCYARLEDRVTYVTKIWAGTFQDYRTRHFVQRTYCDASVDGRCTVRSNFTIFYTPLDTGQSEVLACGVYFDEILIDGSNTSFASKKVVTDTGVLPRYLVYPM
jgi:3-phenylpropionate/cinnamic acid dioxygenase small subunit